MEKRAFDHVLIIMFENEYRSYVMQNPYMRNLAKQGIDLANSFGAMHPSQTNYIASLAAELCNVTYDTRPPSPLPQRTVVDLIEESPAHLEWRAYMDSYIKQNNPWKEGFSPKDEYPYLIKHNPFSSFENIISNKDRWEKVGSETDLFKDLLNGTFPEYAWFTPNMWNDGHYVDGKTEDDPDAAPKERAPILVDQLALWLEGFFNALRFPGPDSHLPPKTLVVVTFDEADFETDYEVGKKYLYDGPNQIYTVLLGDMIKPGIEYEGYNHYSLIKTIEKNFNLGSLEKNDHEANWHQFLWNRHFRWGSPRSTPIETQGRVALCEYQGHVYAVYPKSEKHLCYRMFDGVNWSEEMTICHIRVGAMGMAVCKNTLVLVYESYGQIYSLDYTLEDGWAKRSRYVQSGPVVDLAVQSFPGEEQLMLVCRSQDNTLTSTTHQAGNWDHDLTTLAQKSGGSISLARLGASFFLVFQMPDSSKMGVVSYNTADYNVTTLADTKYSGPYDDTTQGLWSPSACPVAHFSSAANSLTPGEEEPLTQIYRGRGPLVTATLDGVIHLAHSGRSNPLVLTETYSISGVMTPKLPVSYNKSDETTTSNGYGTLAQAGWTQQEAMAGIFQDEHGAMAMTHFAGKTLMLFQSEEGGRLKLCQGEYR